MFRVEEKFWWGYFAILIIMVIMMMLMVMMFVMMVMMAMTMMAADQNCWDNEGLIVKTRLHRLLLCLFVRYHRNHHNHRHHHHHHHRYIVIIMKFTAINAIEMFHDQNDIITHPCMFITYLHNRHRHRHHHSVHHNISSLNLASVVPGELWALSRHPSSNLYIVMLIMSILILFIIDNNFVRKKTSQTGLWQIKTYQMLKKRTFWSPSRLSSTISSVKFVRNPEPSNLEICSLIWGSSICGIARSNRLKSHNW